jgi:hypothetical protein
LSHGDSKNPLDFGYPASTTIWTGWTWILQSKMWIGDGLDRVRMDGSWSLAFWIWTPIQFHVYHQVNNANTNEHKGSLKYTCSMTYLILRYNKIKKRDSHSPKERKYPTNKPNSPLFL